MRASRSAIIAVTVLILGGCSVNVPENAFLYPDARIAREKIELTPGPAMPPSAQAITLPYSGGQLAATRVSSTVGASAPLILFCGGNMFRQSAYGGAVGEQLSAFGEVLLFDYPGYGASTGAADIATMRAAAATMGAYARDIADREQRRLILWGHSLGGTVCAEAAASSQADTLVLETTTPSARAVMKEALGWKRWLVRVHLANSLAEIDIPRTLAAYDGKIIVIEAGRDTVLPPVLSRNLTHALQTQGRSVDHLVFVEAGHNNVHSQPDFTARLTQALARP